MVRRRGLGEAELPLELADADAVRLGGPGHSALRRVDHAAALAPLEHHVEHAEPDGIGERPGDAREPLQRGGVDPRAAGGAGGRSGARP